MKTYTDCIVNHDQFKSVGVVVDITHGARFKMNKLNKHMLHMFYGC